MTLDQLLWECFRHFVGLDESNAAVHCAQTRYSPITFRLAEALDRIPDVRTFLTKDGVHMLDSVLTHLGQYEEDQGR